MTCDEQTVCEDIGLPVSDLGVHAPVLGEHIFDQKRNDRSQAHSLFFRIGEAGHFFAFHHGLAVRTFGVAQHSRRVAHGGHRFASFQHGFDQRDGVCIFCQVPQWTMTTGVENGVKVGCFHIFQGHCAGQNGLRGCVGFETASGIGLRRLVIALGVQWRLAA